MVDVKLNMFFEKRHFGEINELFILKKALYEVDI